MQKMYLILTITNREDEKEFSNFFNSKEIPVVYSTPCHGTAKKQKYHLSHLISFRKKI